MSLYTGPYALASIVDALPSVRLSLLRLVTRPSHTHFALSLRRIRRIASVIVSHDGIKPINKALEDASLPALNHAYEYYLIFIIQYDAFFLMFRILQHTIRSSNSDIQ